MANRTLKRLGTGLGCGWNVETGVSENGGSHLNHEFQYSNPRLKRCSSDLDDFEYPQPLVSPPMAISINTCQYLSISINICQHLSISINIWSVNICQYQSISINIYQYLSISINIYQRLSMFFTETFKNKLEHLQNILGHLFLHIPTTNDMKTMKTSRSPLDPPTPRTLTMHWAPLAPRAAPSSDWQPTESRRGNLQGFDSTKVRKCPQYLIESWWLTAYPSEKYELANWDDDIPNWMGT